MALTVEDGTGLTNAQSYISVADADTYHTDRGNTDWTSASSGEKETALVKATQWIDGKYRRRWRGIRSTAGQALTWPRSSVYDIDGFNVTGIPARLKYATAEAALLIVQGENLSPALERGGRVVSETVGPISTTYESGAPATTVYSAITDLISDLINGPGLRVSR